MHVRPDGCEASGPAGSLQIARNAALASNVALQEPVFWHRGGAYAGIRSVAKPLPLLHKLVVLSSKDLVERVLQGLPVARVPVGPLAVHFCAGVAGVSVREYTSSARTLAESVIRYAERFRPDAVWVSADTWVSAEAMGARVGPVSDDQPWTGLGPPAVQTAADLARIPPADPSRQGRYPLMLDALKRVIDVLGRDFYIVGCFDQYPFSLAAALVGLENLMSKMRHDMQFVEAVMDRALEYALAYGRAMASVGADMLSGGDSPAGLIGPSAYRQFAWPSEKRLVSALRAQTGKPVSLHICGKAGPLLSQMAQTGASVLELDYQVNLAEACRVLGPAITIWGNLDPVAVLAQGTPDEVYAAARAAIQTATAVGHQRFVLSSGCALAMETPAANLAAMMRAASETPFSLTGLATTDNLAGRDDGNHADQLRHTGPFLPRNSSAGS